MLLLHLNMSIYLTEDIIYCETFATEKKKKSGVAICWLVGTIIILCELLTARCARFLLNLPEAPRGHAFI